MMNKGYADSEAKAKLWIHRFFRNVSNDPPKITLSCLVRGMTPREAPFMEIILKILFTGVQCQGACPGGIQGKKKLAKLRVCTSSDR